MKSEARSNGSDLTAKNYRLPVAVASMVASFLLILLLPLFVYAATVTVDEAVSRAIAAAPELGEAQADIELSSAKLKEARGHLYPQIEVLGLTGPVPRAHGNQVFSSDSINEKSHYGWFERGDATLVQPIYTFGKISESMRAARHGIEVEKSRREQKKTEIAQQVKEYYYGALLGRELKELLNEVRNDLVKARDKAKQLLEKNSTEVEEADVYKLDAFNGEVGKYLGEASKGERLALEALKVRMGLPSDAQVALADQRLVKSPEPLGNLQSYVQRAKESRQEFKQVSEGLQARSALVAAARAGRYPDIFVGGMLSAAHASNRSTVNNPWVPDQFNHVWGGIALGVKWKLDFGVTSAKIAEEQAQYDRLVSTKSFAEENIPLQVRKFYDEAVEAETGIKESKVGYENSKKWAVTSMANFDFGVGPAKEIFDSLQEYAKTRAAYFQSIYNYNVAMAHLQYATGGL